MHGTLSHMLRCILAFLKTLLDGDGAIRAITAFFLPSLAGKKKKEKKNPVPDAADGAEIKMLIHVNKTLK